MTRRFPRLNRLAGPHTLAGSRAGSRAGSPGRVRATGRRAGAGRLGALGSALVLGGALLAPITTPATAAEGSGPSTSVQRWTTTADLAAGSARGLRIARGKLWIGDEAARQSRITDRYGSGTRRTYDHSWWTSPWVSTGFDAESLIPSWNVRTAPGTFVRIDVRTRTGSTRGSWDMVAYWAHQDDTLTRHSRARQADDVARLLTDTVVANDPHRIRAWQLRVRLFRPVGSTRSPMVHSLGAVAASYQKRTRTTSRTTMTTTTALSVPAYSQMVHRDHHQQWDGGGEAWCSPTSTAMILDFWGRGPSARQLAWTNEADGQVDHAARHTYDPAFGGTGNWPFNTAYAGQHHLDAFVTRLHSLRDAEAFIRAGIPLVVSVAFGRGELSGAPLSSTPGHLMVVRGFTGRGDVLVNDPAAGSNGTVARTYDRAQLERAWLEGSGGVTYVMRRPGQPLPADSARW